MTIKEISVFYTFLIMIAILVLINVYQSYGYRIKNADNSITVTQESGTPFYDNFGRLRVGNSTTIFESKQLNDNNPLLWTELLTSGSGITSTYNQNRASTILTSTVNTAATYIRQTFRSFSYRSGNTQLILMSAVLLHSGFSNNTAEGVVIRLGNFNTNNGIFFEYDTDTMYVVIRSYVTGTVENKIRVAQNDWNIDKMNGKGPSGILLDYSKIQVFYISYGWLGGSSVNFGFVLNGEIYYVHKYIVDNNINSVYMSLPNNPLRFELNTSNNSPAVSVEQICSTVKIEGDNILSPGINMTKNLGLSIAIPNNSNNYVLQAFQFKPDYYNTIVPNVITVFNQSTSAATPLEWNLILEPDYGISIGDGGSWQDVDNSSLQYYSASLIPNVIANLNNNSVLLASGFANSNYLGLGNSKDDAYTEASLIGLGRGISGASQTLALTVKSLTGIGISVTSIFNWNEI